MAVFQNLELYELHRSTNPSNAKVKLELAKATTQETFELIRTLSLDLRNTSADEGLEVALSDFMRSDMPRGISHSTVLVEGDESLIAPQARDELFLILREGLRNAAKHSGANVVKVHLDITANQVVSTIEDDGGGFEPENEGTRTHNIGLASMAERASLFGGTLSLSTAPGKGTKVKILLPLPTS
jgi:signal transduction histidine kinase